MGQLEPGAGERLGESLRVLQEAARNLLIGRVDTQRQVRGQHGRLVLLGRIVRVGDDGLGILGLPLDGAGRAAGLHPFILEQVLEEEVAPLRRRLRPGDFEAAADGVLAAAGAVIADPAKALRFQAGAFRLRPLVGLGRGAVGLAEGVAAGDERHGLFVVHRHAGEGLADEGGGGERVAVGARTFRIHIDQAHLGGAERMREVLKGPVRQPGGLGPPVHVLIGLPGVFAAGGKAERAEAHGLQRHVAGEDQQVRPGNLLAVFLLDRPEQAARLVDVHVVRPAVERRETLLAATATAPAIAQAVGAGSVPGHADELRTIMAEIGGPPILRVGHQLAQVILQRLVVELLEFLAVVERLVQRIGFGRVLAQQVDAQLVRPPIAVLGSPAGEGFGGIP